MKREFVVDIQVTGRCNMDCDFCCGAIRDNQDQDFYTVTSIIDKFKKAGAGIITFSGGEPLLREDISDLIKYVHDNELTTYLSTNGLLFFDKYQQIKDYIDCLGIPLDSSSEKINEEMGRKSGMFLNNLNILKYFGEHPPNHKIKVGTLVSKVNFQDIHNIGNLFSRQDLYKPDVWRLYQFTPIRKGFSSKGKYEISDSVFSELCDNIKRLHPQLNISELSNEDSDNSYLFVDPKMHLQILKDNEFLDMGDIRYLNVAKLSNILRKYNDLFDKNLKNRRWLYG